MPDARDRLAYVASMTEKAASRALNATENARPIQDKLALLQSVHEAARRTAGVMGVNSSLVFRRAE